MANINIPGLPAAIGLTGSELVPIDQSDVTKRTTTQAIADLANVNDGTVTSVGLTMPAIFSVVGSPITTAGTFAVSLATQAANLVWAGPTTGSAALPTFRALVNADIASLGAALTRVNDTNITLTLTGNPNTALVNATAITVAWAGQLSLARGGTGTEMTDPGADRIMFWDESNNTTQWLTVGTNLSITDTTLNASSSLGIGVGSTSVTGGTTTRVLYDNAGVLDEYAVTGTGSVVMTSGATFTGNIGFSGTTFAGLVLNSLTTAQRDALVGPSNGSVIYNTTTGFLNAYTSGSWGAVGGSLTIGTTPISGGTSTRILYDNGGVLGEYTTTGTGTVVAMQTAPSFLTFASMPRLLMTQAAITADAPQISALTTWNNAAVAFTAWSLSVTNTNSLDRSSRLLRLSVDGSEVAVINRSGFIGSAGSIATSGAFEGFQIYDTPANMLASTLFATGGGVTGRKFICTLGGAADGPYMTGGSLFEIRWASTPDVGSADLYLSRAAAGSLKLTSDGGTTYGTFTSARNILTQGTITDPATQLSATVTWNDGSDTFTAWRLNPTITAAASGSNYLDIQNAGTSKLRIAYIPGAGNFASTLPRFVFGTDAGFSFLDPEGCLAITNAAGSAYAPLKVHSLTAAEGFVQTTTFVAAGNKAAMYDDAWDTPTGLRLASDALIAWSTTTSYGGTPGPTISVGSGSPEGVVTAAQGSIFMRTDGGTDTTLYTKNSGSGNTGWVAVDNV